MPDPSPLGLNIDRCITSLPRHIQSASWSTCRIDRISDVIKRAKLVFSLLISLYPVLSENKSRQFPNFLKAASRVVALRDRLPRHVLCVYALVGRSSRPMNTLELC